MLLLFKAGIPQISTVGDPGTHGAGIVGVQGIGWSTPKFLAVAAATDGFAGFEHIPKVGNLLSIIVAAG